MNDALRSTLKKLRLSGLLEGLEVRLQEAAGNGLTHVEFLELILQDELAVRSDRQLQRRVKAALFRELKPLDQFDWAFNPSIKKKQVLGTPSKYPRTPGLRRCWRTPRSAPVERPPPPDERQLRLCSAARGIRGPRRGTSGCECPYARAPADRERG
jgi:hypothetical protein